MSTVEILRELEAKATPGPWGQNIAAVNRDWLKGTLQEAVVDASGAPVAVFAENYANAALIAAMRNAMPALLRVADAAKARFEVWTPETYQELKEALEALEESHNG